MKLISAIMPTRGRHEYALQAVHSFISQTYENRELVILDDLNNRSFPQGVLDLPRSTVPIVYQLSESRSIAEKRNRCCELANGHFILHYDSDDWSSPDRMADQVARLEEANVSVTGYHSLLFHVEHSGEWVKYVGHSRSALGTSLCYRKSWQQAHLFREDNDPARPNVGEDSGFVRHAANSGEFISTDAGFLMVARIHAGNTNPTAADALTHTNDFRPVQLAAYPQGFA